MYTEEYERRGFPLLGFILKLILIIGIIFLLIWLLLKFFVPSIDKKENNNKSVSESNDVINVSNMTSQIFVDNINKMRDAAISYYTEEKLPNEVGKSETMTLNEMINKKMVMSLIDKNNKTSDVEKSYVKITKLEDEYLLKVNLKDSEKEDYILVHLGCYDYCGLDICQN